ncbi:hypothetical protein BMW23_0236 [Bodo saltans virus]|uniref:Uncharacterized protein n=1 Tax=Bodo saltans virus TaxID=2024608 RepID=A0A2H4UTU7_9VIRU|nr:hypothetical protein QJ851_gp0231 [Bodo saltans virus]ATZ80294.1 hypothetical protein BMW23_0236 [Bodo saltans virus]
MINNTENFISNAALNDNTGVKNFGTLNNNTLLTDSLFSNVVIYNNDADPYSKNGMLGIDKCMSKCDGSCIEFGITGTGWCFPKNAL